jgi:hypothetical protein
VKYTARKIFLQTRYQQKINLQQEAVQEATEMNVLIVEIVQVVVTIVVEKEVETVTKQKVLAVHAETQAAIQTLVRVAN